MTAQGLSATADFEVNAKPAYGTFNLSTWQVLKILKTLGLDPGQAIPTFALPLLARLGSRI